MTWLQNGCCVRVITTGEVGTRLPLLGDAHVHLGLIDPTLLLAGGIGRVQDLGWIPEVAGGWRAHSLAGVSALPEVWIAGAFLTAPGGYPSDRSWAPAGAVREVTSDFDALAAVAEQVAVGASVIKIALNSDAGPVFDDETLTAIVLGASGAERRVVAHVEGAGQCSRAIAAYVDVLAHTPFTELISDALVQQAVAQGQQWMSTIDIHGYGAPDARQAVSRGIALDNLRRFVALGGTVLYGTDLGNGTLPVGVNAREVRALQDARMSVDDVIVAMTAWWGITSLGDSLVAEYSRGNERVTFVPGPGVADNFAGSVDFADWLSHARVVNATELENV
jgi:imidazolonepropionase-like amidohydrolase